MSPGDVIIFVDDHQLIASIPFLGTVVFLFPFCVVFLVLSSECSLRLLYIHRPIFSVQWSSRMFLRTIFYWLSFLIRKTPACCWLLRHPSVSPLRRLTVNCFSEQFLITAFYLYEYNYIFLINVSYKFTLGDVCLWLFLWFYPEPLYLLIY